jgi:catechol-2,3-dioxygenase
MVTEPLNIQDLLSESTSDAQWKEFPPGTSIGHVHLHVSNLVNAKRFYSEILGLNHTATYPGAYFLLLMNIIIMSLLIFGLRKTFFLVLLFQT